MTTSESPLLQDKTIKALREKIEKETGKTPEQLYEEREKRVRDAIELKEPDRVPLFYFTSPVGRNGLKRSDAYYSPLEWKEATRDITLELEPDMCNPGFPASGTAWEALDVKNRLWPGGPLPPDYEYQFLEVEFMKADEYDIFLSDPTDFMIRYYLPRMYGSMEPLAKLPPLGTIMSGFEGLTALFNSPEFEELAKAVKKAGQEMQRFRQVIGDTQEEMALLGFPAFSNMGQVAVRGAPFDTVSSFLRGMEGSMVDMWRRPEKLLQACDLVLDKWIAQSAPADPSRRGNPKKIGMPLWRGDKMFMSDEQFKKFYWPGLKKAMMTAIDLGYIPIPFFEAEFGDRLECLLELPKGKVIASVEHMDVKIAKEILGGHHCILGKGPASLRLGSLREIEENAKKVIDECGKDGGFILSLGLPSNAETEDVKAMINSIKEYARY